MTSESTFSDPPTNKPNKAGDLASDQPNAALPRTAQVDKPGVSINGYLHGIEPGPGVLKVFMRQQALRQIYDHGQSDLAVELGGLLLGSVIKGKDELSIKILATIPVSTIDHGPIHFTFTADAWAQVNRERLDKYPDLDVVGWYHTHPGLGVFFSADDVIVQKAAFVMPWHAALVVDPIRKQGCFFGWKSNRDNEPDDDLAPLPGFWEVPDAEEAEFRTWDYVAAAVWSQKYQSRLNRTTPSQVYTPDGDWNILPPINPWWGVLLGGLSLLISLLLLLDRLLAAAP
ncbi:MAG: hypothetical protein BMS9Abin02_0461 [Anaerolineae bacterium]|nr:MAG: hypothetical protein BMS9Abin02_0461 [Anaerolineae bacterium]